MPKNIIPEYRIAIRMTKEIKNHLILLAKNKGMKASSLARHWLEERIKKELEECKK